MNEAQRLWWDGNCRRGWGTELSKLVCNGQGAKLTWTSTDKCSLLSLHHILQSVASGKRHTHTLPLNSNCDLREIQILFAYSCETIALLFIKALEVLLSFTNPTWFWKREVLSRIFKVSWYHWNFLYKVLTWGCIIIFSLNIWFECCIRSHNLKS